jgi:hypothetical protein
MQTITTIGLDIAKSVFRSTALMRKVAIVRFRGDCVAKVPKCRATKFSP